MDGQEKLYFTMSYNRNHYAVMRNDIIKGKQQMTLLEARLIRILITQIVKQDTDLKTYTCRIKDLAKFLGIPQNNLYRDIKDVIEKLSQRIIKVGTGDPKKPWKILTWLDTADYDGKGTITLKVSSGLKPYLLDLNEWFTQYQLKEILSMSSFYAIRLYELLKMSEGETRDKGSHEFSMVYLREYFAVEDKHTKMCDFKRYVLDIACREINENTDLWVEYEYKKTGRTVTAILFKVKPNVAVLAARAAEDAENIDIVQQVIRAFGMPKHSPTQKEIAYINTWTKEYGYKLDVIKVAYERTIDTIGKLSWQYIDTILSNWYKDGLYNISAIRMYIDKKDKKKRKKVNDERQQTSLDIELIEKEGIYTTPTIESYEKVMV